MRKFVLNGYVQKLKYENISFTDKKTSEEKEVKKCTCLIRMIEDDSIVPIEFWGKKVFDYFVDIDEGSPVICSFMISSREWNGKYYITMKGDKIEKYHGKTVEDKEVDAQQKREHYKNQDEKPTGVVQSEEKSVGELAKEMNDSWEDEFTNGTAKPLINDKDLPF